jgi:hypothetical protein
MFPPLLLLGRCSRARPHTPELSQGTTNGSATWPDPLHPVHRHDVGVCELTMRGSSSTVAVAMRQKEARPVAPLAERTEAAGVWPLDRDRARDS